MQARIGSTLGARILRHADFLSATLQMKDLSACEAQELTKMTVKTLNSIRNDESFKPLLAESSPRIEKQRSKQATTTEKKKGFKKN